MTKKELLNIFPILSNEYSNFVVNEEKLLVWYELLRDLDTRFVKCAVLMHISESKYPPTVAEIRKKALSLSKPKELNGLEAYNEVVKAINTYGFRRVNEAYNSLPTEIVKVIKNIGWRELCLSNSPDTIRKQFIKMYEQGIENESDHLPEGLKEKISLITKDGQADLQLPQGI